MNEILGLISVLVTTNFATVEFAANLCPHPGCNDAHNYTATERYMIVRDTWAEVVGTGTNRRLHSETNEWGSLTHQIAHPAVYKMHTEPGHPVRPGTRWPNDMPPLPPWIVGAGRDYYLDGKKLLPVARRSNAAMLPSDAYATNGPYGELFGMSLKAAAKLTNAARALYNFSTSGTNQYGVLYDVTTNYPSEKLVLEKRGTDRLSNVQVWPGYGFVRYTNPHPTMIVWTNGGGWHASEGRFRAVPATNELPGARRFVP